MSLFWEQAVSESPASQNVAHSELGRSTDTRQIVPGGNWDNINRSCASSQMGYESQHNSYHSSTAVDPYGAAVMGAYQERTETSTKCVQNSIRSSVLQNERIGETVEVALSLQDQRSVLPKRQHTQQLNCQPGDAQMTLSVQSSTALSLCEPVVDVDSAQVAPESLYSLDTLGSDQSNDQREQLQGVNCSSVGLQIQKEERSSKNCEDESGCAKHLKESVTSEVHANNSTNQKVSRPYPCVENFSETPPQPTTNGSSHNYGKVNIDSLEVTYRSAPSTAVVGVQRCEETCRTQDYMPAIAQVAPLRPELDSVLCVQSPTVNTADQTPLIDEVREIYSDTENTRYQLSRPTEEAFTTASVMKNETNLSQSVSLAKQAVHALNEQIPPPQVTPDLQPFDNSLSPFAIKESSTPIDASLSNIRNANNDIERWEPEENKSSNNFYPTANPSEELSVTRSNNKTAESSARNGSERRSVQSRYRMFKEHFSGIMGRLDQYRTEPTRSDFRSSSRTGNPLMANVASSTGRRSIVTVAKTSMSNARRIDRNPLFHVKAEEGNTSMFSHGGPSVDRSFDLNPTVIYGDDFVDAARRTRRARPSRPNSCAKSEVGESGLSRRQFDHGSFAISLPSDYAKHYPSGRRSVHTLLGTTNVYDYNGQQAHMYKERRRPQSSFDPRSMERFQRYGGRYGSYDAYDEAHSSVSDEVNSDDVERDSEEEIRKYTQKGRCSVPREIFDKETVGEEMYYFGAIHLDQFRVRSILHHFPPPMEYYRLPPIEKAAYLFFVAVYKKRYNDVGDFHRKFNREYYKYICEGDSDNIALWKICKSMQDEYHLKRLEESQKAYEASQRQLFSDDRDSVDGMSDRASMDDNHDDHTSDILSVDSSQRAPLKHRVPHAFVTFGPGGKMLTVHPDSSVSVVHIDDIKSVITDLHGMKLIESVQSFKGPLLIGQTPTHSVRLYIERQIKQIRFYERESEKPCSNDVIDCLLIWQLLGIIVQQQGRVTGPDVARLLVEVGSVSSKTYVPANQHHSHREKNVAPIDSLTTPIGPVRNAAIMDARAYDRFTELLLGGHVMVSIDSAIRDGLYADAIVLARRLLSHDIAKLLEIEERFIATRPQCNPVVTLVSVSSKKLVPILINPTADGPGSWRTHAAIILANLTSSEAMETVCDLGKALAKRDFNCAADFCFLAVAVLAGINPFKPVSVVSAECDSRQHITLIHASLPNHDALQCRYGFLLTDLHATEIFDYAMRLSDTNAHSPLAECVEYHRKRVQYAHLIADFGGFTLDAFRYCMEVARTIWNNHHLFSDDELVDICNLADQLRYGAAVSEYESSWITSLRAMIRQRRQVHHDAEAHQSYPPNVQHPSLSSQVSVPLKTTTEQYIPNPDATENNNSGDSQREVSSARRSQSDSFADEARDWHAQRQDPLEMNPLAQHSSCADADIEDNEENVSRSQTQSTASHHGYTSNDREQGPETFTISTTSPNSRAYGQTRSDEPFLTSDDTSVQSTTEGSPNHPFEDLSWAQQSKTESQYTSQISAPNSLSHTTHSHQSQIHSGGNSVSANPTSGSADCSIKKTASTNGSKGFFGNMKEKLMKAIPSGNEMILPDDSKPTIIWDPVKGRYVGTGVEEDTTSVPPPKTDVPQSLPNSGGLRAARTSGGSRYFNPLNQISLTNGPNSQPVAPIPIMQIPTTFGFIPSMPPDDSGESVDPFSGQANPTVHGVELTSVAQ